MSNSVQPVLLHAISFAARAHLGQMRNDNRTPYFAHTVRVTTLMAVEFGVKDSEVLAAAVLHDTIEDTPVNRDEIIEQFGERVAGYVASLTKDMRLPQDERDAAYLETLAKAPVEVKLCKLADTLDNLIDSEALSEAGRDKATAKARRLVEHLAPGIPDEWKHTLDRVRQQVEVNEAQRQQEF